MSKSTKFRETFFNDLKEYLLQVFLFIITSIIYLLFFEPSDKNIFIFLNELWISLDKLSKQIFIYFFLVIFLFVITTVILTIWHWVKNQVKNRNVEIMAGNQKALRKMKNLILKKNLILNMAVRYFLNVLALHPPI